jgi:hypothetical protein
MSHVSAPDSARSAASRLQDNTAFQLMARVGFAVNGLLHLLIGGIALGVAFGSGGSADQGGALGQLASNPAGVFVLWVVTIGLWALGLFQLLETFIVRGSDKDAWMKRGKEGGKALAYLAVGFSAFSIARGGSSDSAGQTQSFTAQLLASPGGVFLVAVLGLVGYIAKGVAIIVVGILFCVAAFTSNASEATGLDGALKALVALPLGVIILTVVALGLIAYGIYCFARAKYARL